MKDRAFLEIAIAKATGKAFSLDSLESVGGGCINDTYVARGSHKAYFVKTNQPSFVVAFESEALALDEIRATDSVRVPDVIATGKTDTYAFLVLEYLQPRTSRSGDWEALGMAIAKMHRVQLPYFGWQRDNLIGATPQPNRKREKWIDFFGAQRLEHQIRLCQEKGFSLRGGDRLLSNLASFFQGHTPYPSLLHGDLWSGNVGFAADGTPFIFDPATYYGDRETDLAFTEFFGGFGHAFYEAYREALPLDPGYERRKLLYNLYHCLNHVALFGAGYTGQAQEMANQLLAEL